MSQRSMWIGGAVALLWLTMMGMLFERELGGARVGSGAVAPAPATPQSVWLGVYSGSGEVGGETARRVGHVHLHTSAEERHGSDGVRTTAASRMTLDLMGRATDLEVTGVVWRAASANASATAADGAPRAEVDVAVRSNGAEFALRGAVLGETFRGTIVSAGEELPLELPVPGDLLLETGFGQAVRFPTLEPGDDVRIASLDPLTLQRGTARVRCLAIETLQIGGRSIEARKLEVDAGGFTSLAWVDENGEVLRASTPLGLEIRRLAPGERRVLDADGSVSARDTEADLDPGSESDGGFLGLTAIRPDGPRPRRGLERLVVRVDGLGVELRPVGEPPSADVSLPSDGAQRLVGEVLTVTAIGPAEPAQSEVESGLIGRPRPEHLAPDPFVQSEHPRILERAQSIVAPLAEEADDWARAVALHDWVYERIDKEPVVSIPSALEVLESRRGDCNEHTVLYTALARAIGLPTRIAVGLVWSDELDGFYYHAWPEVWIADASAGARWIRLDPTLGQPVADATHIKLLEGGIETWPRLLPTLGRLEFTILELAP
ncbi:MAG: transglutaminase-like domain-containing protein [Acidobacteriota bacterium]